MSAVVNPSSLLAPMLHAPRRVVPGSMTSVKPPSLPLQTYFFADEPSTATLTPPAVQLAPEGSLLTTMLFPLVPLVPFVPFVPLVPSLPAAPAGPAGPTGPIGPAGPGLPAYFLAIFLTCFSCDLVRPPAAKAAPVRAATSATTATTRPAVPSLLCIRESIFPPLFVDNDGSNIRDLTAENGRASQASQICSSLPHVSPSGPFAMSRRVPGTPTA